MRDEHLSEPKMGRRRPPLNASPAPRVKPGLVLPDGEDVIGLFLGGEGGRTAGGALDATHEGKETKAVEVGEVALARPSASQDGALVRLEAEPVGGDVALSLERPSVSCTVPTSDIMSAFAWSREA